MNEARHGGRWAGIGRWFIPAVLLLALAAYAATYAKNCFGPPIRDDGGGYYVIVPSVLLQHELGLQRNADENFGGRYPERIGVLVYGETGRPVSKFTIGTGMLMVPFFLLGHAVALISGNASNGYSMIYQHAAGLSGLFYLMAGLFLLRRALARHFTPAVVLSTLAVLLLGTNLFAYGTGISVMSHSYSFFLFSALLLLVPSWYDRSAPPGLSLLIGLTAGMVVLVRPPNVLVLLVLPLYGITNRESVAERARFLVRSVPSSLIIPFVAGALVFLQALVWHESSGRWFLNVYAHAGEGFDFLRPHILQVLFGLKRGVFLWFPILLLVLPGLVALKRHLPEWFWPVTLFLALNLYVVSSWWMWWYGGGFGMRALIESYSLAAFPIAAFYASLKPGLVRRLVVVYSVLCVVWCVFLMELFWSGEIPWEGFDVQAVKEIVARRFP